MKAGTRVRLHPDYLKALGSKDEHGVGEVVGPVPDTDSWRSFQAGRGRYVMVRWPERPLNGHVIEVPALIENLLEVT